MGNVMRRCFVERVHVNLEFQVGGGTAGLRKRSEPGTLIRDRYLTRIGCGERRAIGRIRKAAARVRTTPDERVRGRRQRRNRARRTWRREQEGMFGDSPSRAKGSVRPTRHERDARKGGEGGQTMVAGAERANGSRLARASHAEGTPTDVRKAG